MVGLDGVSWRGFWENWGPHWNTTKQQRERVLKHSLRPTATRNLVFSLFSRYQIFNKMFLESLGDFCMRPCVNLPAWRTILSSLWYWTFVPHFQVPISSETNSGWFGTNQEWRLSGLFPSCIDRMRFATWYKMSVTPKLSDFRTIALMLSTNVGPCS